jgi:hypothetical protein
MQSLNLPDPKKAWKSSDASEGAEKRASRSTPQAGDAAAGPGAVSGFMQKLWNMLPGGPTEEETEAAAEERESSRLPVVIPVTLFGLDESGQAFRETTRTVDISKRGAKILTLHNLQEDTHVWIENADAGKISIAKVIRKGKRANPKEATEICVKVLELLDPEKIWSLETPPQDWGKGFESPTPSQRLEYLLARERLARPEVLSYEAIETTVPEAMTEEGLSQPAATGTPQTAPPPKQERADSAPSTRLEANLTAQSAVSDQAVTSEPPVHFPSQTEAREAASGASAKIVREPSESPAFAGSADSPATSARGSGGERRNDPTTAIENNPHVVRKISESAMDSINAAATEALAQLKAGQLKVEADLATHTAAHQSRLAEVARATEELEHRSASFLEEFQGRLEAALNEFRAKGAAQTEELQKTAETLLDRSIKRLREESESSARDARASRDSVGAVEEQARAQIESAGAEIESRYAARAEAQEKRVAELASAVEGLEQRTGALLKDFEKSLEDTLQSFQQRGTTDKAGLEKAAEDLLENSRRELQGQAETTLAGLGEKARETLAMTAAEGRNQVASTQQALESLARAAQERFDQRLAQKSKEQAEKAGRNSEAALNTIRLSAERAVNRLETAKEEIEEGFSTWADVFQSRLGELFAGMEGLEHHSEALLRDFRRQLDEALQEFSEKKTSEAANVEDASHDVVERLTQQVEERAGAALDDLKEEAEAIVRSAEEASQAHLASAKEGLESTTRAATELYAQRLARASAEQNEQAWVAADEVASSISRTAEESIARMEAAQEKMESRFAALMQSSEKRMAEIASDIEALGKRSAAALVEIRKVLQDPAPDSPQEDPPELPQEKTAGTN